MSWETPACHSVWDHPETTDPAVDPLTLLRNVYPNCSWWQQAHDGVLKEKVQPVWVRGKMRRREGTEEGYIALRVRPRWFRPVPAPVPFSARASPPPSPYFISLSHWLLCFSSFPILVCFSFFFFLLWTFFCPFSFPSSHNFSLFSPLISPLQMFLLLHTALSCFFVGKFQLQVLQLWQFFI